MGHGFPSLTDPRVDTTITMISQFAYGILFGPDESVLPSVKVAGGMPHAAAQRVVFGRDLGRGGPNSMLQGKFYALNGRAASPLPAGASPFAQNATGIFIFKPSLDK